MTAPELTPGAEAKPLPVPVLSEEFCTAFQTAPNFDEKLTVLRRHFELNTIGEPADLKPGVLCALRKEAELYLVEIGPLKEDRRNVDLRLYFSARHAKPAALSALVELGQNGSLHRLEAKSHEKSAEPAPAPESTSTAGSDSTNWAAQSIDLTSFTRLIGLAQNCGMVPNVDNISNARDAEFRNGQYLAAFYSIERMYTALSTAAQQRQQQLRREETAHRSGRSKMSPREWQQKVARDIAKTQSIDRAMNQFRKVMAGLRSLALVAQQTGVPKDVEG
jgi:hypothetical protein